MINRYYVLKESDPSCDICSEWEQAVNSSGGFPFGEKDLEKALNPNPEGRTHLFHYHCKCTLTSSPDGIPIKDELDRKVLFSGALGHIYFGGKKPSERLEMIRKYENV